MNAEIFMSLLLILLIILSPFLIYILYLIRFYRRQPFLLYLHYIDIEVKSFDKNIQHEEITYQTRDGKEIHAWYVPYKPEAAEIPGELHTPGEFPELKEAVKEEPELLDAVPIDSPLTPSGSAGFILFCHGNAGNISQRIDSLKIFRQLGFNTFIFDYRGYGRSEGTPTEKGTYLDAEGAWQYLVKELKAKPEEIIIFGRSLGGGVASYLAQKYHPRALIIESSFTSIPDIAVKQYPLFPVRLLIRYQYNTRKRLKDIHCPILIIHSPDDEIIPYNHGQILYNLANPPKKFLRIKGTHMYGFLQSKEFYIQGLKEFFSELPPTSSAHILT